MQDQNTDALSTNDAILYNHFLIVIAVCLMKKNWPPNQYIKISKATMAWSPHLAARVQAPMAANIFRFTTGALFSIHQRAGATPYECWKLFIDNNTLKSIIAHTNLEASEINPSFRLTTDVLEAFIALQYARGICGRRHSVHFLWNKTYGPSSFRDTMPRDGFFEINKFVMFDNKDKRRQRLTEDTFAHSSEIFETFVANCLFNYTTD